MLAKIIDKQYRCPTGFLGRYIGHRMIRDHHPENLWTVSLLQAKPNDHILELGFGPGIAIQELAKVVTTGSIAGIDFSSVMVKAATSRNAKAIRNRIVDLHHGDVSRLPFENETFDKAFSIHSIYFWSKPDQVLQEIYRVLKPGGILVLTVLPRELWNEKDPNAPVGTPECTPYSREELTRMLTGAGFSKIRVEVDANPEYRSNFSVIGFK